MFEKVGEVVIPGLNDDLFLELADMGAEDIDGDTVYVSPNSLAEFRKKLEEKGMKAEESRLGYRAKSPIEVGDKDVDNVVSFLEELEEHEEVLGVFAGFVYEKTL